MKTPLRTSVRWLLAGFLAVLALPGLDSSRAQNLDLPFDSGSTGADGELLIPTYGTGGTNFGMAYDSVRQEIIRYGGLNGENDQNAEVWVWTTEGWTLSTTISPARWGCAMAYHAGRNQTLLFGGGQQGGTATNATVVRTGTSWATQSGTLPTSRQSHAMVYDSVRGEIVMFGGDRITGQSPILGDTWVWNGTWTQKSPATSPSPRANHVMAFDVARQEVVLFGGGETWTWDGTTWTQKSPATSPSSRNSAVFCYDEARQQCVLFGGSSGGNQTWVWDGTTWTQKFPATVPASRVDAGMVYDTANQRIVMAHGSGGLYQTWAWDGTNWELLTDTAMTFDLRGDEDAVWNFTSISIPTGVTLNFKRNAANTGVVWLASEGVTIAGTINLNGADASTVGTSGTAGGAAPAGPGGFPGGVGGTTGGAVATTGSGPGGGAAGAPAKGDGADATHEGAYGNAFAIPLLGGSGGGGGGAGTANGFKGGSGGGALLIASSRDIEVTGTINARPGARGGASSATQGGGGHGSGGIVRLAGDRILASTGTIDTTSTLPGGGRDGRVRLEGYVRQFNPATVKGNTSAGVPVQGNLLQQAGSRLFITQVAGQGVSLQPTGDVINPDVLFSQAGPVEIVVQAVNIPNGTPVTLTINHGTTGVATLPAVLLSNGQATFTTTVATGTGTLQASSVHIVGGG